jgi:hypothetical protein
MKKKLANGKYKASSQSHVKGKVRGKRAGGRRRAGGKSSMNGASTSSSDERPSSDDDEDEYNSDDYLPDKNKFDEFDEENLLEEIEDDDEYVPRRSAKTVAKRRGQMSNDNVEEMSTPSSACCTCSKTDRPESLLLCDDCDDAYHLECLTPALLSVPDGNWYCPLCEHKRLSDGLIDKFIQLIKEYDELEIKRNQCMSKRSNRLANVMLNLDRMVKRSSKKRRPNGIVCSGDEDDDDNDDDDEKNPSEDEDSVYGFKDDDDDDDDNDHREPLKRLARPDPHKSSEPERLGVRSCRRKAQNYRFDDYDKKMKEAMLEAGVNGDEIEKDSGNHRYEQ